LGLELQVHPINRFMCSQLLRATPGGTGLDSDQVLRQRCSDILRRLCDKHGILPDSYIISRGLDITTALVSGAFLDLYRGEYNGQLVAVKTFRSPGDSTDLARLKRVSFL
jgi:hypothetical protein